MMPVNFMGWTITILIALLALGFAVRGITREHRWLRTARFAQGQIVQLVERRSSKSRSYYPRVQFTDHHGAARRFEGSQGDNPPAFVLHETVKVAYDDQPDSARIVTFGQRYGTWTVIGTFSLAVLILRAIFLVGNHLVPRIYLSGGNGW